MSFTPRPERCTEISLTLGMGAGSVYGRKEYSKQSIPNMNEGPEETMWHLPDSEKFKGKNQERRS